MKKVQIKDGMYEGIVDLYNAVAIVSGYKVTEDTRFDCRKINCSKHIQNNIFEYYKSKGMEATSIGMNWCCFGPKALDELDTYDVEFEDGFMYEEKIC